jgi:hypothetical protein
MIRKLFEFRMPTFFIGLTGYFFEFGCFELIRIHQESDHMLSLAATTRRHIRILILKERAAIQELTHLPEEWIATLQARVVLVRDLLVLILGS